MEGHGGDRRVALAVFVMLGTIALAAGAASGAAAQAGAVDVVLDGHRVFAIGSSPPGVSVQERAALIDKRLAQLAQDLGVGIDEIQSHPQDGTIVIDAHQRPLAYVTDKDAAFAGQTRASLAASWVDAIRAAVAQDRDAHSERRRLLNAADALGAALALVLFLLAERRLYRIAEVEIARRQASGRAARLVGAQTFGAIMLGASKWLRWLIAALIFYLYVLFNLRFVPGAYAVRQELEHSLLVPVVAIWSAFVGYLPNLFFLAAIVLLAYAAIRLNDYIFNQIGRGALVISGFPPDLTQPTAKLIRFGLVIAAAVAAFPYLPGSHSAAFQGISIFLGVLLSIGSSGAISNMISGIILVYMRPFHAGDRVSIAGTVGDVVERNILITRIRTVKHEIITIPNSAVMGAHIINYSDPTRNGGLILHTSVTIGYDAPWRTVHDLLIAAARGTPGVLPEPAPFVLQTALNDFYVTYQINAYTADAHQMAHTYSALHANIQDRFNEGGIEINSPHYGAIRDGNRTAVPDAYLPPGYRAPGFRIDAAGVVSRDRAPAP